MKRGPIVGIIVVILAIILVVFFYPSGENPSDCAKGGETAMNDVTGEFKECCSGLIDVGNLPDGTPEECDEFINMEGFGSICTDCGNGVCESWENKCICSEDCL